MRCKQCDYRLWNLRGRECPECGTPFKPSDFEFVINAVRFCCPQCNQPYYGTGERGHLMPMAFDCVSCGRHIHMDETIVLPTENVSEEQTQVDRNPWLERHERGRLRGWLATVGQGMAMPHRVMDATPPDSSVAAALGFAAVTWLVYLSLSALPAILVFMAVASLGPGGGMGAGTWFFLAMFFVPLLGAGVYLFVIFIWAAVTHLLLRVSGPLPAGMSRTMQAICYSAGTNVFSAVPCLSLHFGWIGWIWWMVSATLMVHRGHRVSGGRAAFATLTLPLVIMLALGGMFVWTVFSGIRSTAAAMPALAQMNQASGQTVAGALLQYAASNNGRLPEHASELLLDGSITLNDLTLGVSMTMPQQIAIGSTTGGRFEVMMAEDQRDAVQQAIDALPANTVAYRMGDMVFTYPGIDLSTADPQLWLLVASPDPQVGGMSVNTGWQPDEVVAVHVDGTTTAFPRGMLTVHLQSQNAIRATYNLPPLPDPTSVRSSRPHTAPAGSPMP